MRSISLALWRDEQGLVMSAELIFITCIVAVGMVVGLSAYRDGVVSELADNARAVGQVNQSYSVAVAANPGAGITVAGNVVTVTRDFGQVQMTASFNNFSYTDTADFCEDAPVQRDVTTLNEANPPPALLP